MYAKRGFIKEAGDDQARHADKDTLRSSKFAVRNVLIQPRRSHAGTVNPCLGSP